MFWLSDDSKPWFRQKVYGLGSGYPIAWQGWVLTIVHGLLITGLVYFLKGHPLALIAAILPAAIVPLPLYAARTEGGWHWRWGGGN